jgi:putative DNA primase/helicase
MRAVEAAKEAQLLSATSTSTTTEPHMVTKEVFAVMACAVALVNHGRRWDVKFGSTYSAFSDEVTAESAIADVHRAAVNNALYLNAYPIGDTKPDMPPAEVLAQYQDVVARFPELALTPNGQIGLAS